MNLRQHEVVEYLLEENRVLREQIGNRHIRFTADQRCRLAARAKKLSRKVLREVATLVTPETLLAWHRKLIAHKYDGSGQRNLTNDPGQDNYAAWSPDGKRLAWISNRNGGHDIYVMNVK